MKKMFALIVALSIVPVANVFATVIIVENSADRFEVTFDHDDFLGPISPVGAAGGATVDFTSGGESASIAITLVFRDAATNLTDLLFVFESLSTDVLFPGPVNPGDVLSYTASDFGTGDGLLPGFAFTEFTVIAGPDRDDAFDARLVLHNVPEPGTLGLLVLALGGLAARRVAARR